MASTYMDNFRKKTREKRDQLISEAENRCNYEKNQINNQRKHYKPESAGSYAGPGCLVGGILGLLTIVAFGIGGILLLGLLGAGIGWIMSSSINSSSSRECEEHNAKLNRRIRLVEEDCKEKCRKIELNCDAEIEQEKKRYLQLTSEARKVYGGSTVLSPMVTWLADQFAVKIRAADRGPYLQTITASLRFRVDPHQLVVQEWLPHSCKYNDSQKFDFYKNTIKNVPDFFNQVGLAQALEKHVEFQIKKRFPKDPVSPSANMMPKITYEYDDATIEIKYSVQNPSYRVPVDLRTGV